MDRRGILQAKAHENATFLFVKLEIKTPGLLPGYVIGDSENLTYFQLSTALKKETPERYSRQLSNITIQSILRKIVNLIILTDFLWFLKRYN